MANSNFQYQDKIKINIYLDNNLASIIKKYHRESGIKLIKIYNDIIRIGWEQYKKDMNNAPKKRWLQLVWKNTL